MATGTKATGTTVATDREAAVRDQSDEIKGTRRDDSGRLLYFARRPFGYNGVDLDRGQIFALGGLVNDAKLNRIGYMVPLVPTDQMFPCRYCKAKFVDLNTLNAHGAKRHRDKDRRPELPTSDRGLTVDDTAAQTQVIEREGEQLDRIAPLNLDKTTAARA